MPLNAMSCKINTINNTVNQILEEISNLNLSGVDINVSGLDDLAAQVSNFELLVLSQLDVIESLIGTISGSATCNLAPVLEAISASEQLEVSLLEVIEMKIDALAFSTTDSLCTIIAAPTTITQPGSYCLGGDIANNYDQCSRRSLNLNGYK